jgi:phenylpropionate dioxygenase-like ring-hydroxylating dioxygenase large terminal subunit
MSQAFPRSLCPEQMLARIPARGARRIVFGSRAEACAALHDRCSHRFAPLSRGTLQDGVIKCGHHGLRFEGSDACVHNPHGTGAPPKAARLRIHRALERHGLIWWWSGDATKADDSLIPDYSFAPAAPAPRAFAASLRSPDAPTDQ